MQPTPSYPNLPIAPSHQSVSNPLTRVSATLSPECQQPSHQSVSNPLTRVSATLSPECQQPSHQSVSNPLTRVSATLQLGDSAGRGWSRRSDAAGDCEFLGLPTGHLSAAVFLVTTGYNAISRPCRR